MIRRAVFIALLAVALVLPRGAGALMSLHSGDAPPPFTLSTLEGKRVGTIINRGGILA